MTTPSFTTRYMFSVKAELDSYKLGETPAGCRVDIDYKSGTVKTDATAYLQSWSKELMFLQSDGDTEASEVLAGVKFDAPDPFQNDADRNRVELWLQRLRRAAKLSDRPSNIDWFGLEGNLISGSDWLLVRTDGVAEMDGRITLQEELWEDAEGTQQGGGLINTQLSSVVDLYSVLNKEGTRMHLAPRPRGSAVYEAWKKSNEPTKLRFALAIRFAAAEASQPWAAAEYRSLGGFWRAASLPLYEYTANVEAEQIDGLIQSIKLDVWRTSFLDGPLNIW